MQGAGQVVRASQAVRPSLRSGLSLAPRLREPAASVSRRHRPRLVSLPTLLRNVRDKLRGSGSPAVCLRKGGEQSPSHSSRANPRLVSPPAPQAIGFLRPAPRAAPCLVPHSRHCYAMCGTSSASPGGLASLLRSHPRCLLAALGARPPRPDYRLARRRSPRAFFLSFPRKRESRGIRFASLFHSRNALSPSIYTVAERCHSDGAALRLLASSGNCASGNQCKGRACFPSLGAGPAVAVPALWINKNFPLKGLVVKNLCSTKKLHK